MICSVGASGSGAALFWLAGFRVQLTGMRWGRPLCRRALAMLSPLLQLRCSFLLVTSQWFSCNGNSKNKQMKI